MKPSTARSVSSPEPQRRLRAVWVGTNRETRHEATAALEGQGFAVRCVGDAEKAYRVLVESRADALLLSTELPDSEGLSLCRRAVSEELVPAIYFYGPDRDELAQQCFDAGGDDYLATPFRWTVCARRLAHLSNAPAAASRVGRSRSS